MLVLSASRPTVCLEGQIPHSFYSTAVVESGAVLHKCGMFSREKNRREQSLGLSTWSSSVWSELVLSFWRSELHFQIQHPLIARIQDEVTLTSLRQPHSSGFWPLLKVCYGLKLQSLTKNDTIFQLTLSEMWVPDKSPTPGYKSRKIKGNSTISKPRASHLSLIFPWGVFVLLWMMFQFFVGKKPKPFNFTLKTTFRPSINQRSDLKRAGLWRDQLNFNVSTKFKSKKGY